MGRGFSVAKKSSRGRRENNAHLRSEDFVTPKFEVEWTTLKPRDWHIGGAEPSESVALQHSCQTVLPALSDRAARPIDYFKEFEDSHVK